MEPTPAHETAAPNRRSPSSSRGRAAPVAIQEHLDCFVAALLAMTVPSVPSQISLQKHHFRLLLAIS
jgi:hypothetical protein